MTAVTKVGWLRRPSLLLAVSACSHQGGLVNAWTLRRPSLLLAVGACSHQGGYLVKSDTLRRPTLQLAVTKVDWLVHRHYVGLHYNLQSPRKLVSGKTLRRPTLQLAVSKEVG